MNLGKAKNLSRATQDVYMFPKAEIIETNGVNLEVFHKGEGAPIVRCVMVGLSMLTPGDTKSIRWSKRVIT